MSHDLRSASTAADSRPEKPHRRWNPFIAVPAIVALGVLTYLAFFSEKSLSHRIEYQHQIDSLEQALQQERDTLEYYRELNRRLNTDPELMEQVVREQYNMKRDNEDVFVFED